MQPFSGIGLNVNPKVYHRDGEKVYHLRRPGFGGLDAF